MSPSGGGLGQGCLVVSDRQIQPKKEGKILLIDVSIINSIVFNLRMD